MAKRTKKTSDCGPRIDILETMRAEINEAVELMRAHFPGDKEMTLRCRAEGLRQRRYQEGHWPDFSAVAKEQIEAANANLDDKPLLTTEAFASERRP
jgi:hypothetical protein